MASVTFPEALGGNGQTYTDDADPNTGLDGLGYTIRFIPCLQQAVAMGLSAKNDAQAADGFVQQCQTLRQEAGADRQAVAEDRAAVEQHLQDAQARIGTTQALIDARDTALAAQAGAEDAETGAVAAQTSAEAARDAAVVSGQVYPDTSAGLTATSDGQYFKTVAANQAGFLTLWRNNAGVATEIETYPSLTGIAQALEQANRRQTRLARSLQRLGDHGQTLHSDFDLDAHGLGTALVGGVQDALDSGELWTTVRETPTLAYQHVEDGTLKYVEVPPNVLAREWNPETGRYQLQSPLGAMNRLRWSTKYDGAGWTYSSQVAVTPTAISIIEGCQAYTLSKPENAAFAQIRQSLAGRISEGVHTLWFLVNNTDGPVFSALVSSDGGTSLDARVVFDTDNLLANSASSESLISSSIQKINDGLFVAKMVFDMPASSEPFLFIYPGVYNSNNAASFTLVHAQLVEGTELGPVIVTEDAPVTRAVDNITRELGPEGHVSEGTWVIKFTNKNPALQGTSFSTHVLQLKDNSIPNSAGRNLLLQSRNRDNNLRLLWTPTGLADGFTGSLILASGILSGVMAVSYKMGSVIKGCANGGAVVSDDQTPPDFAISHAFFVPYDLKDISYEFIEFIPTLVTDAKLQELAAL